MALHWDNVLAAELAMLGISESVFLGPTVDLLLQEEGPEETRWAMVRARRAMSEKTVRDALAAERERERKRRQRQAELERKAKGRR